MAHLVLKDMELKRDILDDPCYGYIFSVEDVNGMVIAGVPFREAYRVIGERVQRGEYHAGGTGNTPHARGKHRESLLAGDNG